MNTPQETRAREAAATFAFEQRNDEKSAGWNAACDHIANAFRHEANPFAGSLAFSNVAHPQGDREALARIIDPEAFRTLREIAAEAGLDASNPPAGVVLLDPIDGPRNKMLPRCEEALAKADAILALSPAPDGDYVLRSAVIEEAADKVSAAIPMPGNERQVNGTFAQGMFEAVEIIRSLAARPSTPTPEGLRELAQNNEGRVAISAEHPIAREFAQSIRERVQARTPTPNTAPCDMAVGASTPTPDNIGALRAICEEVVEVSRGGLDTVAFLVALNGIAKRAAAVLSPTPTDMGEAS